MKLRSYNGAWHTEHNGATCVTDNISDIDGMRIIFIESTMRDWSLRTLASRFAGFSVCRLIGSLYQFAE